MKILLSILIALSFSVTTQTYAFYNMGDAAADFSEGYQSGKRNKANRNTNQQGGQKTILLGCDYGFSSEHGTEGYTGTYQAPSGIIFRLWFGSSYCKY